MAPGYNERFGTRLTTLQVRPRWALYADSRIAFNCYSQAINTRGVAVVLLAQVRILAVDPQLDRACGSFGFNLTRSLEFLRCPLIGTGRRQLQSPLPTHLQSFIGLKGGACCSTVFQYFECIRTSWRGWDYCKLSDHKSSELVTTHNSPVHGHYLKATNSRAASLSSL